MSQRHSCRALVSLAHAHTPRPQRTLNAALLKIVIRNTCKLNDDDENYTRRYDDEARNENKTIQHFVVGCGLRRAPMFTNHQRNTPPSNTPLGSRAGLSWYWRAPPPSSSAYGAQFLFVCCDCSRNKFPMRLKRDGIFACDLYFFGSSIGPIRGVCERERVLATMRV